MHAFDQIKTGGLADPTTLQGAVVFAIVFAITAWLVGSALRLTVQRVLSQDTHDHLDRMAVKFLAKLVRYGVYLLAFIGYAHYVPVLAGLGTASLASFGILSVVVGLAAQNTLGNLVAGISLLLYRPFKLGDRLQVAAPTGLETGVVESLTLGYTLLRTDDNRRVVVSNSLMASQTAINLTANDPRILCSVLLRITYESNWERAREILLELGGKHPQTVKISGCPLTDLGEGGVLLSLDVWCADAATAITLRCDLLEQALKRFTGEGISLAKRQMLVVLAPVPAPAEGRAEAVLRLGAEGAATVGLHPIATPLLRA